MIMNLNKMPANIELGRHWCLSIRFVNSLKIIGSCIWNSYLPIISIIIANRKMITISWLVFALLSDYIIIECIMKSTKYSISYSKHWNRMRHLRITWIGSIWEGITYSRDCSQIPPLTNQLNPRFQDTS